MNFKLLKSNSCSSRLELVGTNESDAKTFKSTIVDVKEIIKRLENTAISNNFRPRIVEAECIEKIPVTVNKQIILTDLTELNKAGTVNRSIKKQNIKKNAKISSEKPKIVKVNRNKNVDLAFGMKINPSKKPLVDKSVVTTVTTEIPDEDFQQNQTSQDPVQLENVKIANNENTYGKHYVLNDNRVFKKSNFEIEFEEFEIYDPVNK